MMRTKPLFFPVENTWLVNQQYPKYLNCTIFFLNDCSGRQGKRIEEFEGKRSQSKGGQDRPMLSKVT